MSEKTKIHKQLVSCIVECHAKGGYTPLAIRWYNGKIYPIEVGWHYPRKESYGEITPETWTFTIGKHLRTLILDDNGSWYVLHDPNNDQASEEDYYIP